MSFFLLRVPVIHSVLSTDVLIDSYKALHISFLLPCKNCVRLIHESVLVCQYVPRLSGAKDRTEAPEEVTRSVVQWISTTHTNNNNYCRYLLSVLLLPQLRGPSDLKIHRDREERVSYDIFSVF